MIMLGELLARDAESIERWLAAVDAALREAVSADATAAGLTSGDFVRDLATRFSQYAGPDAWTHLIGRLGRADDPAAACVQAMLDWQRAALAHHASHEDLPHAPHE